MSKRGWKITVLSVCCLPFVALLNKARAANPAAQTETQPFYPGEESHRLSFLLGEPRRFASRFNAQTRTLQIRVIPARAREFDASKYYDSRYVHRVVVEENNGEVVLNLQLKNMPLGWVVASQNNPWRLLVDLWQTEPQKRMDLEAAWNWQMDSRSNPMSTSGTTIGPAPRIDSQPEVALAPKSALVASAAVSGLDDSALSNSSFDRSAFPENFGRLEPATKANEDTLNNLKKSAGEKIGTPDEFSASARLAEEFYRTGREPAALVVYRRLVAANERQFKENPRLLWSAGESAYLTRNFDLANDYFRSLLLNHPGSEFSFLARLRLADIDLLGNDSLKNKQLPPVALAREYSEIALSEKSPWSAKIATTLRILHGNAENNVDDAKLYQQNLNACSNTAYVPIELKKNCAYIQTRYTAEKLDVLSADNEVQKYKKLYPNDTRIKAMETGIEKTVLALLQDAGRTKAYDSWIEFEQKARPGLLEFTLNNADLLFTRAEAWNVAGEPKNATQLYGLFWQRSDDENKKNEAAALTAQLFLKMGQPQKADLFLRRLQESETRKAKGLSDAGVNALRFAALSPYRNPRAQSMLLDEMKFGRYQERELAALSQLAQSLRGKAEADGIYEKIQAYPAKSADENKTVETALLLYAEDLRNAGRLPKAADTFFAVANMPQSTRRAEAAYKAGIAYARAGLLEKAKTSWQLAAADLNDKRFSSLASERLERIR